MSELPKAEVGQYSKGFIMGMIGGLFIGLLYNLLIILARWSK